MDSTGAEEPWSPVLRYSSELGDRQVQQLLAHLHDFRLRWGRKKKKGFFFFKYMNVLQMETLFNQLQ